MSCASAHTAAPRTSGLASDNNRSASVARAPSPELPIAISTLRTKRSRPMRLTGDLAKTRAECGVVEPRELGQRGRAQLVARGKLRLAPRLRELVPGADRQAIVAAIDAVADRFAEFVRDRSLVLDREIGDAAPRIELVGRGERRRRTDVEAGAGRCRNDRPPASSGGSSSVVKIAPRNSHEPNSRDTRLVCLPCQPRPAACASGFSITGGGVDEHLDLAGAVGDQPARQRLQPLLDHVVIVVALGIDRDRAARALLQNRKRILVGTVIDAEHDDRAHVGPQPARIGAALRIACQPVHVAMRAGIEEIAKVFRGQRNRIRRGDADAVEAERARFSRQRRLHVGSGQKSRST